MHPQNGALEFEYFGTDELIIAVPKCPLLTIEDAALVRGQPRMALTLSRLTRNFIPRLAYSIEHAQLLGGLLYDPDAGPEFGSLIEHDATLQAIADAGIPFIIFGRVDSMYLHLAYPTLKVCIILRDSAEAVDQNELAQAAD